MDVVVPDLGDIETVEVIELCASVGAEVRENDVLIVIESDKASMEIPSPIAGTLKAFSVKIGDEIKQGDVIASVMGMAQGADAPDGQVASGSTGTTAPDQSVQTQSPAQPVADVSHVARESGGDGETSADAVQLEVLVPDLGEATGVVVIEVMVALGDRVEANDLLVVLESDKASMEITAEQAGEVLSLAVEVGQEIEQGSLIATLAVTPDQKEVHLPGPSQPTQAQSNAPPDLAEQPPPGEPSALAEAPEAVPELQQKAAARVYAGPAVRRLARELGVSLEQVAGSGNRGRITKDDIKAHVKQRLLSAPMASNAAPSPTGWPHVPAVDFAKFGPIEMVPLTRIQQHGATNLHRSWVNLPHVTAHDEVDISDLEDFRQSLRVEAQARGVKVTTLAFLIKACCKALAAHPQFNASLHEDGQQLVLKRYINIGLAVDTSQGLVVPVIKSADAKSIWELSVEIAELADKAREKKLAPDEMQGGTFSISSLGALGGTGFTPIVNAPEVAILGVAKLQTKPLWQGEQFVPRKVLPLSLSYDHRVINGADGGRFMGNITTALNDVRRLAL